MLSVSPIDLTGCPLKLARLTISSPFCILSAEAGAKEIGVFVFLTPDKIQLI